MNSFESRKSSLVHSLASVATMLVPTLAAIAAFLAPVQYVNSAPVYSQVLPSEPVGAFTSINTATAQKVADNFLLEGIGQITIRSLRFLGGYGVNSTPPFTPPLDALPPDNFRIVFLEDTAGGPGMPITEDDFSITSAFSRTPTGGQLLNGLFNPIEYVVDLGNGLTLNQGTVYWISVSNAPGPDHGWAWARAEGVLDMQLASTNSDVTTGPWIVGTSSGMWFELDDQNIPEPKSLIILATALFLIALRRSSRWRN